MFTRGEEDRFEIVPIAAIHAILDPLVMALLEPHGFESVGTLKWVRSHDAPIRQIFTVEQWKGGSMAPSWGLSLDFVPHFSAGRLKWHRTAKSARADIRIDSRDASLDVNYTRGREEIVSRSPDVIRRAIPQAQKFWDAFRTTGTLPAAVAYMRDYLSSSGGLGFYNYVQAPVAAAIIYARNGMMDDAARELSHLREDEVQQLRAVVSELPR